MGERMMRCVIVGAAPFTDAQLLKTYIRSGDYVIAADGGLAHMQALGQEPHVILGDFDSADRPNFSNVVVFPKEKDQTDSELAIDYAIAEGYSSIWLIAPFGGRIDHTIANLNLLRYAHSRGIYLKLYDGENLVYFIGQGTYRPDCKYQYYSFFPMEENTTISLDGFKYPLDHYVMNGENSLCVSNEPDCSELVVEVHQGLVLCVCIEKETK